MARSRTRSPQTVTVETASAPETAEPTPKATPKAEPQDELRIVDTLTQDERDAASAIVAAPEGQTVTIAPLRVIPNQRAFAARFADSDKVPSAIRRALSAMVLDGRDPAAMLDLFATYAAAVRDAAESPRLCLSVTSPGGDRIEMSARSFIDGRDCSGRFAGRAAAETLKSQAATLWAAIRPE